MPSRIRGPGKGNGEGTLLGELNEGFYGRERSSDVRGGGFSEGNAKNHRAVGGLITEQCGRCGDCF